MTQIENDYNAFLRIQDLSGFTNERSLEVIANLVDLSGDLGKIDGIHHAFKIADQLRNRDLDGEDLLRYHYYMANAWSHKRSIGAGSKSDWEWESEETEEEVIHLRMALNVDSLNTSSPNLLCSILTNLGNLMSRVGRFVEAITYWNEALKQDNSFPMALGNKGIVFTKYAEYLYDRGHSILFLQQAHGCITAINKSQLHWQAQQTFDRHRTHIESMMSAEQLAQQYNLDSFQLGKSEEEIRYRKWCLTNCLFLNPLNDLGPHSIAARDIFSIPSITIPITEGPYYHGYFNQMKQEFVSARYLFYESMNTSKPHFADSEVLLYNTLDYPAYSLAAEKAKAGFRSAYAILDKIAYFLKHYLKLSIPEKRISFRTFWYELQERKKGLRPEFKSFENWPLRGLFWLSKDLYEDKPGFRRSMDPTGKSLAEIRNHLEHKYLKLHDSLWIGPQDPNGRTSSWMADSLAYSLYRRDFEAQTLMLLKVVRAGLIYLSLSVHREEGRRASARHAEKVAPMPLDVIDDQWKV